MSDVVRFHLSCVPPTTSHHHKKIARVAGFSRLVDKDELVAAKGLLEELLLQHQIPEPITGPVTLCIEYTWPWRKSALKRDLKLGRVPHTSKPDLSNLTKTLEDRLKVLRFIEDDNAVVDLHVRKWWGNNPGIDILIAPFNSEPMRSTTVVEMRTPADLFELAALE